MTELYRISIESEMEDRKTVCEGIPSLILAVGYAEKTFLHYKWERELEVSIERYYEKDEEDAEKDESKKKWTFVGETKK